MPVLNEILKLKQATDPKLKNYQDLRWNRKPAPETQHFITEGRYCVQRLLQSQHRVHSVLVTEGKAAEALTWADGETPVYSLPSEEIRKLVGFDFHRGVMACGERPALSPSAALDLGHCKQELIVAIIGVSERENVGSIMRTAAAMGIQRILLGPNTADPFARRTIRVSMGTVFRLQLYDLSSPLSQLTEFTRDDRVKTIVSTLAEQATPLRDFRLGRHSGILVIGNEADGVAEEIQQAATDRITIPMKLGTNSLNVSVATAICLHELINQIPE